MSSTIFAAAPKPPLAAIGVYLVAATLSGFLGGYMAAVRDVPPMYILIAFLCSIVFSSLATFPVRRHLFAWAVDLAEFLKGDPKRAEIYAVRASIERDLRV